MKADPIKLQHSRTQDESGSVHSPVSSMMDWNRQTRIIFFLILFATLPVTGFAESIDTQIQKGISQYHEGAFKGAGESFSSARAGRPEDPRIAYNQGNSYYKDGNFQEALKAFGYSASDEKNPDIRKRALYNTGNTLVKLEKLEEAESAFKKVLTLDPSDMDAKYNLEYVREQLKKKEEQKQDQQKNKDKDSDSKNEPDKKQKSDEDKDSQAQNQPPSSPPEDTEPGKNEPETPAQTGSSETELKISEEEAERMLDRLTEDLKSISRMQAGKTKSAYKGNDW